MERFTTKGAVMLRLHLNLLRLRCIRRGHSLHCTPWGHCCARCGAAWPQP